MPKHVLPILLLVLVLQACTPPLGSTQSATGLTSTLEARSTREGTPRSVGRTLEEPTRTATPNPTRSSSAPTLEVLEPEAARSCPVQQEVPLEQLDMDPRFRLLLRRTGNAQSWEPMIVSSAEPTPRSIPNTGTREGWPLSGFAPSPGGGWLELDYADPTGGQRSSWLSSFDGVDQWKVITLDMGSFPVAISDEEWVVVGIPEQDRLEGNLNWTELVPLASIDPLTGDTTQLADLPDEAIFDFYFAREGGSYAVYHTFSDPAYRFYLFSYSEGRSIPAFQWLVGLQGWHSGIPRVYARANGLFATSVYRTYGLDLAADLRFDDILEQVPYSRTMRAIALPGGDSAEITTLTFDNSTSTSMVLVRYGRLSSEPELLFVLDYEAMSLTEYCLDFALSDSISMSPDGRLLATTIGRFSGEDDLSFEPTAALVLDTVSGHYSRIEGYSSIGWGIVDAAGQR